METPWVGNAEVTEDVVAQLASVREDGGANMFSRSQVYAVAVERDFRQLRAFCAQVELLPRHDQGQRWGEALDRLSDHLAARANATA